MDLFQKAIATQLAALKEAGVLDLPLPQEADVDRIVSAVGAMELPEIDADPTQSSAESTPATGESNPQDRSAANRYPQALPDQQRRVALKVISDEVENCRLCRELSENRTQTVFGIGNSSPRLCFLGEAPGADEDRQGEPFVGNAGQLLTRIIEACKLSRDEVYILNTIKCRPPGNRNPAEDEIEHCWRFAHRQLEILQPEIIVCLGSVAARTLLDTKQSVGRLRQHFHEYRGSAVAVTYHPAYLLRNPSAKRSVWDDMKMVMGRLGIEF